MKHRIVIRYILRIIPLIFGLLLISGAILYFFEKNNIICQHQRLHEHIRHNLSSEMKQWVEAQIAVAKTIAEQPVIVEACSDPKNPEIIRESRKYLHDIQTQYPHYDNIWLAEEAIRHPPEFILSHPVKKNGKIIGAVNIAIQSDYIANAAMDRVIKGDNTDYDTAYHLKTLAAAGTAFFILLGIALVVIAHLMFVKPIQKASQAAQRLSTYDLTVSMDSRREDEIGHLLKFLKLMAERFREVISMISDTAQKLTGSINDISSEISDQASIASEQSASVSQITATMAQLSSSFTQIAEHSDSVAKIADKSLQNTKEGADAVKNIMVKMDDIHKDNQKNISQIIDLGKKSKEISKVMEIINTITDQTKLIAFNAALEASSAGAAGKRFGVVAMEIRRLADNVMESTDEIESKISEIQSAVDNMIVASEKSTRGILQGLEYSTQTAAKLTDIVKGSQATVDAARQISLSTQQQKIASEQVLIALREIDKGAEQSSLSISHLSSISKILTDLSENLQQLTDKFVLQRSSTE
jgi:methyl-accepting chemotaxis protein